MERKIGTVTFVEGRKHRQTFETAAWYRDFALHAGTYDLFFCPVTKCLWAKAVVGTVTGNFTGTLYGGRSLPGDTKGRNDEVGNVQTLYGVGVKVGLDKVDLIDGYELSGDCYGVREVK